MKNHSNTIFPAEGRLNKCHARPASNPAPVDRTEMFRIIVDCIGIFVVLMFMVFMFMLISAIEEPAPAHDQIQQEVQHGNYTYADSSRI